MAPHNKVLQHPDRDDIIKMLTEGMPVRDVEAKLKTKYSKRHQAHLRVSASSLQVFKTEHLNLKGEVLASIKEATKLTRETIKQAVIREEVKKSSIYQEKINAIADDQLSVHKELIKAFSLIESRIEFFYNKIASDGHPDARDERVFQKYLEQFTKILEDYKKYVEGYTETSEHNININIMNDQVVLIREAVREVLAEIEPELAVLFMGKLNTKMNNLIYRADGQKSADLLISNMVINDGQ